MYGRASIKCSFSCRALNGAPFVTANGGGDDIFVQNSECPAKLAEEQEMIAFSALLEGVSNDDARARCTAARKPPTGKAGRVCQELRSTVFTLNTI